MKRSTGSELVRNKTFSEFQQVEEGEAAVSDLCTFDYLAGESDRHLNNLFFDPDNHEIRGIDYSASPGSTGIPRYFKFTKNISGGVLPPRYTLKMREQLDQLNYTEFRETLRDFFTDEEIESGWLRVHIIRKYMRKKGSP